MVSNLVSGLAVVGGQIGFVRGGGVGAGCDHPVRIEHKLLRRPFVEIFVALRGLIQ